ncbi:MAG TPA: 16S rRNA (cytosine(1402)-N(4))-methyltransferase [Clostridium sp.]|jgi:16S rRNA (cytosine1402-N4)-methyltransferase|uniref:Ribosomal RNA small subunit methyltransferase H n=1 Tax=Clostridium lapidicellarium TaxID=3240931 RepID=A0ABV4DSV4_9CLOT|nr:16S rRNA (cytosine(1402)-N(4))-methyltransferase RsmH [uncultured Clostridium sp.]NLU08035.1 16S rRNA (cytosine(1402)-N(4))-methyltransferase RsmH [Clostridiales bacterium]HBC97061.1 16S rRNA (cytosine(1402)-N(4))-methyltransferase [Clostridium sp.]
MKFRHVPVLLQETIDSLNIKENGTYVDCTLGGGGHSREILKSLSKDGKLIGIDEDISAIDAAKENLKEFKNVTYIHGNFYYIKEILDELKIDGVDGILMDLGVSSYQIDNPDRGFSYMKDAPLDMRMDRENSLSAYDVVNKYDRERLYRVLRDYGEEKFANRIADSIVRERRKNKISTTFQLVDVIKRAVPLRFQRNGHPAKRTFQGIRIEVNRELEILDRALEDCVGKLKPGGRISVIDFHSLEDRIVKLKFRKLENPCTCPPSFPVCVCNKKPVVKIINKKPIVPSEDEKKKNPRSKSSKLRTAEKI